MARSGSNGIGGAGKGIGNRKHEGGRYGIRREERRLDAMEKAKQPSARANTGVRSAVRYGHLTVAEALKRPVSDETRDWLVRRPSKA